MDVAELRTTANEWIKDFALALKNVSLYSAEHPRGRDSISRSYERLRKMLESRPSVTILRMDNRLTLDSLPLDRDRIVASHLCKELTDRGVTSIAIAASVTQEEYTNLVRSLLVKADRVHERGGLDLILLDEGVSSITVNREKVGKPDALDLLTDLSLLDLLAGRIGALGGETLNVLMQKDPEGLARTLAQAAARRDKTPPPGDPDLRAELTADSLERMAERAIEEKVRDRPAVLGDVARILAASEPDLQVRVVLEKSGPRSPRRNLAAAVDGMPADAVGQLVAVQYAKGEAEIERLQQMLDRVSIWKLHREDALKAIKERLSRQGIAEERYRDLVDHLMWAELDVARRLQLLNQQDYLWKLDFQRVKEVLVKLFATDQLKEATALVQKYLSGLLVEDAVVRRRVAENARYILHLIEKTGKGSAMLGRIGDLFLARIQDESDEEVQSRIAAGLAFLADLRLRQEELGGVLELMRRAETLSLSSDAAQHKRGERLVEALSRIGNEKLFKVLTERHLQGAHSESVEAAEFLRRAGVRSANYLIDRLAEEDDRGNRAQLVSLLKEMGRGTSLPFTARLKDTRWFLVRNVVHILGEIGDVSVVPALREIGKHSDVRVRKELVRTFMRLGTPECEDLIIESLVDLDRGVQVAAVSAMSVLKGPRSAGIILDIIRKTGPFAGVDTEVREEAVLSSGRMGLEDAVDPLSLILTRKGFIGYAEPAEMRVAAVQALGAIGGDAAIEVLRETAQKDARREVRDAAIEVLNARGVAAT